MSVSPASAARVRSIVLLVVLVAPMVVRTTSPLPPPYHQFYVTGTLVRTGGGPLQNYTIGVAYKQLDSWQLIREGTPGLAITSDGGAFSLMARTYEPRDSIAVCVVPPGEDLMIEATYALQDLPRSEIREFYKQNSDGCCDDPATVDRVAYYSYVLLDVTITIP